MVNSVNIVGLDISTHTGFVMFDHNGQVTSQEVSVKDLEGIERSIAIASRVNKLVPDHSFIVMEGYAYANQNTLVLMVEIGTLIRERLALRRLRYIEVAPNTLKKFVIGKGQGKKDIMMKEIYKRWGFEGTDNECDAYALAQFGRVLHGDDVCKGGSKEAVKSYIKKNKFVFDKIHPSMLQ